MANLLFYLTAFGALAAALGVVSAKNPVWSVLSLLGCFFCLATIYLLAGFQFMAAAQILVYAGAIMVLFLFVIMLLNLAGTPRDGVLGRELLRDRRLPIVLGISGALLLATLIAVGGTSAHAAEGSPAAAAPAEGPIDSAVGLAEVLFGRFLLAFEATSILLLAAAVAVLVLAKRQRAGDGSREGGAA